MALSEAQRKDKARIKLLQQGVDPDTIDEILGPAPEVEANLPYVDHKVLVLVAALNGKRVENLSRAEIEEAAINPPPEPTVYEPVDHTPNFVPSTYVEARAYRAQQLGVDERNLTDQNLVEARGMIVRKKKK